MFPVDGETVLSVFNLFELSCCGNKPVYFCLSILYLCIESLYSLDASQR